MLRLTHSCIWESQITECEEWKARASWSKQAEDFGFFCSTWGCSLPRISGVLAWAEEALPSALCFSPAARRAQTHESCLWAVQAVVYGMQRERTLWCRHCVEMCCVPPRVGAEAKWERLPQSWVFCFHNRWWKVTLKAFCIANWVAVLPPNLQ